MVDRLFKVTFFVLFIAVGFDLFCWFIEPPQTTFKFKDSVVAVSGFYEGNRGIVEHESWRTLTLTLESGRIAVDSRRNWKPVQ